jgi:UDP-3-O-[3-hydroxymyristoyl] glucosamine N-acyltransferase
LVVGVMMNGREDVADGVTLGDAADVGAAAVIGVALICGVGVVLHAAMMIDNVSKKNFFITSFP